jgi:hypothetical protein
MRASLWISFDIYDIIFTAELKLLIIDSMSAKPETTGPEWLDFTSQYL